ncbi:MAG: hypothetical protein EHM27_06365, partial [Deltaproteobacteria bacterium]
MTWTHKRRMLATIRGEMPDKIPYAPRLDLWFAGNQQRGTLPEKYRTFQTWEAVSRDQNWAVAKVVLDYQGFGEEALWDRPLGIYRIPVQGFLTHLPKGVERTVKKEGDHFRLEYRTPKGNVCSSFLYSEAMRRSGVTIPWISEHALKGPEDYPPLGYIFENLDVEMQAEAYRRWTASLGDDGLAVAYALTAGSPMHHIMKILVDSTAFYYLHRDHARQMQSLAESIGVYFRKVFRALAELPAEVYLIGANFDDTITYPPFFRNHILPWLQEAAEILHSQGKYLLCHTDGENKGLMDYLLDSGMDVADSVCPAPMTKVTLEEYYRRWGKRLTIIGGIPSNLLLAEATTDEEFESYLDDLFKAVPPGNRLILGVADTVPPDARFDRLLRIAERVDKEGRLPLEAGAFRPPVRQTAEPSQSPGEKPSSPDPKFEKISRDLYNGLDSDIKGHVQELLDQGIGAKEILNEGLLKAMEAVGIEFKNGVLFVPEVLLAARTMNEALKVLEPLLAGEKREGRGKILIGTVLGDMHDIGKNMVAIMLRGVGFEVVDLGINIPAAVFVQKVSEEKPQSLGLSALLTTTMPQMKLVIEALSKAGLRDRVRVMV